MKAILNNNGCVKGFSDFSNESVKVKESPETSVLHFDITNVTGCYFLRRLFYYYKAKKGRHERRPT